METKRPTVPWNGCMLEVDAETERIINKTVDRILPGWREAAGLLNPTKKELTNEAA